MRFFDVVQAIALDFASWRRACKLISSQTASARSSMDRASDYGSEGWGFESLRARSGPPRCDPPVGVLHFYQALLRECFFHAHPPAALPSMSRRDVVCCRGPDGASQASLRGGVDADGGLKEKPPPLHETWGVMKLSSPQHAQIPLFLPIFDEQGRFFFHAACESTFSCSTGAVFLSLRSLDASCCERGSASVRTLRHLGETDDIFAGGVGGEVAAVPVGGGGAWPGFETTRRAKLAARTVSGRAAAHGHIKQPGPTGHTKQPGPNTQTAPGTPAGPQAALRNWEASRPTARSAGNAIL